MKYFLLTLAVTMNTLLLPAQIDQYPCGDLPEVFDNILTNDVTITFSSIYPGKTTSIVNDGVKFGDFSLVTATFPENEPYIEFDLRTSRFLRGLSIYYPAESYDNNTMSGFYIFMSAYPIIDRTIKDLVASPNVSYVFVEKGLYSGLEVPLEFRQARFVRLQKQGGKSLSVFEIELFGNTDRIGGPGVGQTEVCGNGIDDDGDCKIDCEDQDCAPVIYTVAQVNPSCPICNNGSISISAWTQQTLQYSLDGGATWMDCPNQSGTHTCKFENLGVGTFNIMINNGTCIVEYPQDITLTTPTVDRQSNCDNGGFEAGDFSHWTASQGHVSNGVVSGLVPVQDPISNAGFSIGQAGVLQDPSGLLISGPSVNSPTNGTYIATLGDPSTLNSGGQDVYQMTNCFEVTSANADFAFNYALVLANPKDHAISEQPEFRWRVYVQSTGVPIDEGKSNAAIDYFDENIPGYSLLGWTCEEVDLSTYIGQTVCAEYTILECGRNDGSHGAYAYIDAICQNAADNQPNCDFNLETTGLCGNEPMAIMFSSNANNFTSYKIDICDENGQNCTNTDPVNGFTIQAIDIYTLANNNGVSLQDGKTYTVKLKLDNKCGSCEGFKKFTYHTSEIGLDFPGIVPVCFNQQSVILNGTSDCLNCSYLWNSSPYLNNVTLLNPTVDGTFNLNAFNQTYTLTAKQEFQDGTFCTETTDVKITTLSYTKKMSFELNDCEVVLKVEISSILPVQPSDFNVKIIDQGNGNEYTLGGVNIDSKNLVFAITLQRGSADIAHDMSLYLKIIENATNCSIYEYWTDIDRFFLPFGWKMYMPNVFKPTASNPLDRTFYPTIASPNNTCDGSAITTSVTYLRLRIYDRWGGLIFEKEAHNTTTGLFGKEIEWDGFIRCGSNAPSSCVNCISGICYGSNQQPLPYNPGVFVWVLDIESVQNENCSLDCPCSEISPNDFCSTIRGKNCTLSGDVHLNN